MRVERAANSDLAAIHALGREALNLTRTLDDLRQEWASDRVYLPVLRAPDGRLVGYANVWRGADELEVTEVVVCPDQRRSGFGHMLMQWVIQHAIQNQLIAIHLEVRASNLAAVALYEQLGFRAVGIRKGYYRDREDACLYSLSMESFSVDGDGG
ncbi:MAG: ribosomal protein S18-alanine N-acetyltransferase [Myxococcota bacterium]|nr:ribosomal protein S18-alanine N-acetyltransferase [Myxococcota bacterium]